VVLIALSIFALFLIFIEFTADQITKTDAIPLVAWSIVDLRSNRSVTIEIPFRGSAPYNVLLFFPAGLPRCRERLTYNLLQSNTSFVIKDSKGGNIDCEKSNSNIVIDSPDPVKMCHFGLFDDSLAYKLETDFYQGIEWPGFVKVGITPMMRKAGTY
jgi:hypothetical protein